MCSYTYLTTYSLGDVINAWRAKDLELERLPAAVGPDIVEIMKIPHTYCWSPALVPKPADWGDNIGQRAIIYLIGDTN